MKHRMLLRKDHSDRTIVKQQIVRAEIAWRPLVQRALFAIFLGVGACGLPSEQSLVDQFEVVRPTLDTLRGMSDEDSTIVRIAQSFVDPPGPRAFTPERWNRYRQLFRRLDSEAGLTRGRNGVVSITVGTAGLAVSGTSNGYVYFPVPPSPDKVLLSLEGTRAGATFFRKLDGGWYLFLSR